MNHEPFSMCRMELRQTKKNAVKLGDLLKSNYAHFYVNPGMVEMQVNRSPVTGKFFDDGPSCCKKSICVQNANI